MEKQPEIQEEGIDYVYEFLCGKIYDLIIILNFGKKK